MPVSNSPVLKITKSKSVDYDDNHRGNWSSQLEFVLSGLSYAVGLGNVWRFPYLVYRNGGGAFFIPYTIMLLFVGLPLFFMELAFGQYASEGPITIWKISPLFQGLGYAMFLMSAMVGVYYNMLIAWALFYLFSSFSSITSFTDKLPWSSCENEWNTMACRKFDASNCTGHGGIVDQLGNCIYQNDTSDEVWKNLTLNKHNSRMPSDEYFHNFVLDISEGIHDVSHFRVEIAMCLLIVWLIVFFCLVKGVKSMGKVVYFTAIFPYFVLSILLIRGITLDGAIDGIKFYLVPDFNRLTEVKVWKDAAMQIFFSLSPCWGGLITLASYNKFNNDCLRDTLFIAFGNCGTSIFAGFVIFSVIGFMAKEIGVPVAKVATGGAGLAFVVYPEAVSKLPLAPIWSFLFFAMLLTLGLGTQFTLIETVVTTIVDTWPRKFRHRKALVLCAVCGISYTCGLTMCTNAGMYILQLMDDYCASYSALTIGLIECIAITWVYGVDRFLDDIKEMLGHFPRPRWYWSLIWTYICPSIIFIILVMSFLNSVPSMYGDYVFPDWANRIGWLFSFTIISAIPLVAIRKIFKSKGSLVQRIAMLIQPASDWGPKATHRGVRLGNCSPKHTDSQVPLASNYDQDNESNDYDYCKSPNRMNIILPDDPSDTDVGLRLTVPNDYSETGF